MNTDILHEKINKTARMDRYKQEGVDGRLKEIFPGLNLNAFRAMEWLSNTEGGKYKREADVIFGESSDVWEEKIRVIAEGMSRDEGVDREKGTNTKKSASIEELARIFRGEGEEQNQSERVMQKQKKSEDQECLETQEQTQGQKQEQTQEQMEAVNQPEIPTGILEEKSPVFDWDTYFDQGNGKGTLSAFLGKLATLDDDVSSPDTLCSHSSDNTIFHGNTNVLSDTVKPFGLPLYTPVSSEIFLEGLKMRVQRRLSNVEIANGASLEERSIRLSVHTPLSKILEFISEGTQKVRFDEEAMLDLIYHPSEPWGENDFTHPVGSMTITGIIKDEKNVKNTNNLNNLNSSNESEPFPLSGIITLNIGEETRLGRSVSFSDIIRGNDNAIGKEVERYEESMIDAFRDHNMKIMNMMHSNLYDMSGEKEGEG